MIDTVWTDLLDAMRAVHRATPAAEFCPFPNDLTQSSFAPHDHPASRCFLEERFGATAHQDALDAARAAAPFAHWRETYKDTAIGADFMERFGCYCLIGPNAPWTSSKMFAFFVYMPADLWYPWHQHPAEEMYVVLAGEGLFLKEGAAPDRLGPGRASFHATEQPHALLTQRSPVLAYVIWRNHFDAPPVLTPNRPLTVPPDLETPP